MAKKAPKYSVTYTSLYNQLKKGEVPSNLFLVISEKILSDELIRLAGEKFIGEDYNPKEHLNTFFTDDNSLNAVLNECSNADFFSTKKLVVLKVVRKAGYRGFSEDERKALLNYYKSPNPDIVFIIIDSAPEGRQPAYAKLENTNLEIAEISSFSEPDYLKWVKSKFGDYKVEDSVILHFIQLLNMSFDEIAQEIEKLKTFCLDKKEVTLDDVNLCIGFSRDFNENQFIAAVLSRDANNALKIYNSLILKKDVEIYLLILLNSAFIALTKLFDPSIRKYNGWELKQKLRIWSDFDRILPVYKKYVGEINELKLKCAFNYIYTSEKALKSSNIDRKTVFTRLITNLTSL